MIKTAVGRANPANRYDAVIFGQLRRVGVAYFVPLMCGDCLELTSQTSTASLLDVTVCIFNRQQFELAYEHVYNFGR